MQKFALVLAVACVLFGLLAPAFGIRNTLIALAVVAVVLAVVLAVRALILAARKTEQIFDDELDRREEP